MNASKLTRPNMVIAVDGPSGSGKSSISKESATRLGFNFLDFEHRYFRPRRFHPWQSAVDLTFDISI